MQENSGSVGGKLFQTL